LGIEDNEIPVLNNNYDNNNNNISNDYNNSSTSYDYYSTPTTIPTISYDSNNSNDNNSYTVPTISYDFNSTSNNNDYNQVIPIINDNDFNQVIPISDYNNYDSQEQDFNSILPPPQYQETSNTTTSYDKDEFSLFDDVDGPEPIPIKKVIPKYSGFSLFDDESEEEEPAPVPLPLPLPIQEKIIPKVSKILPNKHIDASKQNIPKVYPLKVNDSYTIYKELQKDTIVLYLKSRECNYQSDPIDIQGLSVSAVYNKIKFHFGFDTTNIMIIKLEPDFETEEKIKKTMYQYYHTTVYKDKEYVAPNGKWESGHYLVRKVYNPIHRSSWTPYIDIDNYTANYNPLRAFKGTETKGYDMSTTYVSSYEHSCPDLRKKDEFWYVLDFLMYTNYLHINQDKSKMTNSNVHPIDMWDYSTIRKKKESLLKSIQSSKCILCQNSIYQSTDLVCDLHYDQKLSSKYERCKDDLFKDLSIKHHDVVENKINKDAFVEDPVELCTLPKEKFCYAEPQAIMDFFKKRRFFNPSVSDY